MKGIIKIWTCETCERKSTHNPTMCNGCGSFSFNLSYEGNVTDSQELTNFIYKYKNTSVFANKEKSVEIKDTRKVKI